MSPRLGLRHWGCVIQRTVFPSPDILQCYIEFDVRTIVMLEKLLGSKNFGTIVGHLVCRYVILPIFSKGLGLSLMVQCAAFALLGCWVLIVRTQVFCFQRDDHLIFLNV